MDIGIYLYYKYYILLYYVLYGFIYFILYLEKMLDFFLGLGLPGV
jgi:hypothetical protein